MTSIPPSQPVINLVGSFAGTQRTHADPQGTEHSAALRDAVRTQAELTEKTIHDLGEPGSTTDRDADGRMLQPAPEEEESNRKVPPEDTALPSSRHAPDPFGERGLSLDVDA